jgi:leader peptidase (prepilin peptidase)/N-methyltransferase
VEWTIAGGTVAVAILGLAVGWFLTTVVARVPAGLPLLKPGPACDSCHIPLAATEQIPVLSWLLLRGRCRTCGAAISAANPLVEAGTAIAFVLTYLVVGPSWELPALWYLAALSVSASVIDLAHHRLPDRIVLPSYPITLALLLVALLGDGSLPDLGRALLAGVALFVGYFLLALVNPSGMGGGDVKLAGVLGMFLGWYGWAEVVVGGLAGFFIGAIAAVVLLVLGRAGRKTHIPFGPFMFAGTYVGLLAGAQIADWYLG